MNPRILHIETSGEPCSVALTVGSEVLYHRTLRERHVHSAALASMIAESIAGQSFSARDLDAIAVSIGPGSYTGLRVGLSTAKAISYATGASLIAVDTLQSLAWTALAESPRQADICVAALDARRMDAYIGAFGPDGICLKPAHFITITEDCLDPWLERDREVLVCGEGLERWEMFKPDPRVTLLPVSCDARCLISSALEAFQRGDFADVRALVPEYVKAPNITIPARAR